MKRLILAAVLVASPAFAADADPPGPPLSLEQKTLLRCSAAFAIIANEQSRGIDSALAWPPLGERGKEYFVQAGATLMDQLALSEEQVEALYRAEIQRLLNESATADDPQKFVTSLMEPACCHWTRRG